MIRYLYIIVVLNIQRFCVFEHTFVQTMYLFSGVTYSIIMLQKVAAKVNFVAANWVLWLVKCDGC